VIIVAQKLAVDELTSIRQQMKESTAETATSQTQTDEVSMTAATASCETQTEADSEIVELREQLQKSTEALSSQRNNADLLQQQLESQTREIDTLRDAFCSEVFKRSAHLCLHTPRVYAVFFIASLRFIFLQHRLEN